MNSILYRLVKLNWHVVVYPYTVFCVHGFRFKEPEKGRTALPLLLPSSANVRAQWTTPTTQLTGFHGNSTRGHGCQSTIWLRYRAWQKTNVMETYI